MAYQASGFSTVNVVIDGNGNPLLPGVAADFVIDFNGTIFGATLLADQVGSCVLDIWKDTFPNFDPTVADSICAAAKPTISAAKKSQDLTLTGWTKNFLAGDIFRINIDSISTITRLTLALKVRGT